MGGEAEEAAVFVSGGETLVVAGAFDRREMAVAFRILQQQSVGRGQDDGAFERIEFLDRGGNQRFARAGRGLNDEMTLLRANRGARGEALADPPLFIGKAEILRGVDHRLLLVASRPASSLSSSIVINFTSSLTISSRLLTATSK